MRIINPKKKSDVTTRMLHHFHSKFDSVLMLRIKMVEELKDVIPDTTTFKVGYIIEVPKTTKMSIATIDDINAMYARYNSGEILLWCEGKCEETSGKRKRDDMSASRFQDKDYEIDEVTQELKEKHADKFDYPTYRLWARCIVSNLHDSMEHPPKLNNYIW